MLYHIIWNIILPEFIKNVIIYIIIKIKFGAYKTFIGNCYIDFKDLKTGKIKLGKNSYIGEEVRLNGNIEIGRYTYIAGSGGEINGSTNNQVKIGNFCSIGKNVFIISYIFHNSKKISTSTCIPKIEYIDEGKNVIIGNDVRLGANVTILPGVTIGNGCIIGAGSIVTKDIPDYGIAVGNPAKVIKYRFDQHTIIQINKTKWWNWNIDKIKKNYNLNFIDNINE